MFHFTSNLQSVLRCNELRPGKNGSISLTRNINTPFYSYSAKYERDCLILNQRALSQHYRMVPQFGDSREKLPLLLKKHTEDGFEVDPVNYLPKNEQEERLFGTIRPLNSYLIAIVVIDEFITSSDPSMTYVKKVSDDSGLVKIMNLGLYSKQHNIPIITRSAVKPNGTWSSDITKKVQKIAARLSKKPQ